MTGQLTLRIARYKIDNKEFSLYVIVFFSFILIAFSGEFLSNFFSLPVNLVFTVVAIGIVFGIVGGATYHVMLVGWIFGGGFGTVIGMFIGWKSGAAFCALFGTAVGVAIGTAQFVVGILSGGIAVGIAGGIAFSIIGGIVTKEITGVVEGAENTFIFSLLIVTIGVLFFLLGVVRLYFWLPELAWMLCLRLVPVPASRSLPWLPPQLDQVIILPLPFMPGLIAEAYQENRTAARSTIDYLITSTNQQKTAAKAISKIAAEECSRCQSTGDIDAIKEQLNWISDRQQSDGLKACFEISQDVTAALEASSIYRKGEQMGKVVQKIERKRNALATASAREATTFGSVLDSWQRILKTAQKTLKEQAKHSNEIPQVYLAGPSLDPDKAGPLFKGRRDLFRQIETLTLSAQHPTLVMYGGRRTGKTSTLNYLPKWMPSDILPLLVDGQSLAATSTLSGLPSNSPT
ncbi:MAG: hypothetical protein D3910_04460 [Candidatus Electrothrix sp. ATG2]|nr:hypothetical protein [Candidatus Electrothrix sp. ATG2]